MMALSGLTRCLRGYYVDGYIVDLYIPEINLAVECDELGHEGKKYALNESIRESDLREALGCSFLRFNPHEPGFSIGKVLNRIFCLILEMRCAPASES